MVGRLS
jgi:26S proteasome regulatory subunit T1